MRINEIDYDEEQSDCIVNLVSPTWDWTAYKDYYKSIRKAGYKGDSKTLFLATFGKQLTCRNYSRRNWIWTFANDGATIYCLVITRKKKAGFSEDGVSWEYNQKLLKNQDAARELSSKVVEALTKKAHEMANL